MLDVLSDVPRDDSIIKMKSQTYLPYNSNFQKMDENRIPAQNQSNFLFPHNSVSYIEGKLSEIIPATVEQVTLTKKLLLFLFSEIRLEANGFIFDQVKSPGNAVTMKQYVSQQYGDDALLSEMGSVKIEIRKNGSFSYCVTLKYLMGFFKIIKKL